MAVISSSDHSLSSGDIVTIRSALPADAVGLLRVMKDSLVTSEYLIRLPEEFSRTRRRQKAWIRTITDAGNELLIVAEIDGLTIGMVDVISDMRRRVRHTARFGVAVDLDWQNKGIGTLLVRRLIAWATDHPAIERIELHVHDGNQNARVLYEKLGFQEEGRLRNAIKYDDGHYMDDIIMARTVGGTG